MFQRCLPNCGVKVDARLASCVTSSIRADGGKLDAKETLGRPLFGHEPASDIDSLKALDPDPPIRETDID
jgi:hypothetical protein